MAFPSPPWRLQGQAWASVFWAARDGVARAPYAAAWVDYAAGGLPAYRELIVARMHAGGWRRLTVSDIWVDSSVSRDGGRALWALPKEMATFRIDEGGLGVIGRASWTAEIEGHAVASASFADTARVAPRLPFAATLQQPRVDGPDTSSAVSGSGRTMPCLGHWEFDADGLLGWLAGKQPLVSFRIRDARLVFA